MAKAVVINEFINKVEVNTFIENVYGSLSLAA